MARHGSTAAGTATYDLVLTGGRVIDPESGLDDVRDVGITSDSVDAISVQPLRGRQMLDVSGFVVAPGFVDMHSHCHETSGQRLQVCDGVTTALELEAGVHPVGAAYARAAREGRPINYGFSASWAATRMNVLGGIPSTGTLGDILPNLARGEWQREANTSQVATILDQLEDDLAEGGLGIGILVGYAPRIGYEEYAAVAGLAARHGVPTFTHARDLIEQDPLIPIDGAEEIVRAAGETGAHMHYCHIHSTSMRHLDRVFELISKVRAEGAPVTTEAYPYGAAMTGIGAAFLDPESLLRRGLTASSIQLLASGRRIADAADLRLVREKDPGALAIVHFLDEANRAQQRLIYHALQQPDVVVASDAIPPVWRTTPEDHLHWPLHADVVAHPRTSGTFGRTLRVLVREQKALSLPEAIRRCALLPAQIVTKAAPAMARKGRLRPGADADVVVFDPTSVTDRATYTEPTLTTSGFRHVIVNGRLVVRDGRLDVDELPGRPVRAI